MARAGLSLQTRHIPIDKRPDVAAMLKKVVVGCDRYRFVVAVFDYPSCLSPMITVYIFDTLDPNQIISVNCNPFPSCEEKYFEAIDSFDLSGQLTCDKVVEIANTVESTMDSIDRSWSRYQAASGGVVNLEYAFLSRGDDGFNVCEMYRDEYLYPIDRSSVRISEDSD